MYIVAMHYNFLSIVKIHQPGVYSSLMISFMILYQTVAVVYSYTLHYIRSFLQNLARYNSTSYITIPVNT